MRSASEARALAHRVLGSVQGADQAQVAVDFEDAAYARFARNYVVQNLAQSQGRVDVTYVKDQHVGTASTSNLSDDGLKRVAAAAAEIASRVPVNHEFVSLARPAPIERPARSVYTATRDATPDDRVAKLLPVFARMQRSGLAASGFTTTQAGSVAVVNSLGVDAAHETTYGGIEIKAMAARTSGFAEYFSRDYASLDDPEGLAARLDAIPGVVGHGLFLGMTDLLIVGHEDGSTSQQTPTR